MTRYALVVGISKYKSRHLADLGKPEQDAEAIAALLDRYGQFDTKPTVLTGNITQAQLVKALRTLLEKQAVNSSVFIYFTGHGISVQDPFGDQDEGHLATSDTEVKMKLGQVVAHENAIPFTKLNNLIQKANLNSLVMLIDACHSGDFVGTAAYGQSFSAFNNKPDCLLLASCQKFEEALAKKSEEHSLFTSAVLKALVPEKADSTGAITSGRLADELKLILRGSPQKPEAYGRGLGLTIIKFPHEESEDAVSVDSSEKKAVSPFLLPTVPLQMPPLPDHFVERPAHQDAVKNQLLRESKKSGTLVVSAIYGLGGIGKSVLASKLAHDGVVQTRFKDGILWATLGQNPDILPLLSGWIQALGDRSYKPTALEPASNHLRTLLYGKKVLLIVDDVWNPSHLEPFRVGSDGSCVLVTTREARISEAHRYDLDVMDEEQSLELMTQKMSGSLTDSDYQKASAFAERVGYLPLALELAASQVEEGTTWTELLEELQLEVGRIEVLDLYGQEEIPDDAKRRKYSLLACFNLSLKLLSPEQLCQFAWLGVLPEDVDITQTMTETLWQVTSSQSKAILRTLRSKALLLQGASQINKSPRYRMHDLMHDLARRLLIRSSRPLETSDVEGLGLTKSDAHSQLLERYKAKTKNDQWHTLKDDGYIYAHLTWHMLQSENIEAIHHLLREENDQGRNGWFDACEALGQTANFVTDVGRAWELADDVYREVSESAVSLQFYYLFIIVTLNSLASNISPTLVGALTKCGLWQPTLGLAYARQAYNPVQKGNIIAAIAPFIPPSLFSEVTDEIFSIHHKDSYLRALSSIVPHLPEESFLEILELVRSLPSQILLIETLIDLAPICSDVWVEAFENILIIESEEIRSQAFQLLISKMPDPWVEALVIVRLVQDKDERRERIKMEISPLNRIYGKS